MRPHWTTILGFSVFLTALAMLPNRLPDLWRKMPFSLLRSSVGRLFLAAFVLLLVAPCLRHMQANDPHITLKVLDVGQAQAVLLEWSDKGRRGRALIDGGGFSSDNFDSGRDIIAPLLTTNQPLDVDYLFVSHPDWDHLKGLLFFAKSFPVKKVYSCAFSQNQLKQPLLSQFMQTIVAKKIPHKALVAGDRIEFSGCPGLMLEALAPAQNQKAEGNNGLVLRLAFCGKGLALLPGDANVTYLRQMVQNFSLEKLSAEILVLPHHGSVSSFLPLLYAVVQPQQAVVSSAPYNKYRLPSSKVVQEMATRHIPLHNTATQGIFVHQWLPSDILKSF